MTSGIKASSEILTLKKKNALRITEKCCCEENNISQQCSLVVKAASHILGYMSMGADSRFMALIFLCPTLGRSHLMNCVPFRVPQA